MRALVILSILALCVLHHDLWWWDSPAPLQKGADLPADHPGILFGFMPIGLAWHAGISLAAGLVWLLAVRFCWPTTLEQDPEELAQS